MTDRKSPKVAFIGLDAMDANLIRTWAEHLPTLKRSIAEGVCSDLASTCQPLAGSVWPSFYTGQLPSEHGIYHHLQWHAGTMRLKRVSADWLYAAPFWHDFAEMGLKVASLDTPMLAPKSGSPGTDVVGWGTHDQLSPFYSSSPALAKQIKSQFGIHPMGYEIPVRKTRRQLEVIRDRLVRGASTKGQLSCWFAQTVDWDFINIVFGECHRGGHILWADESDPEGLVPENALLDVYRAVDEALGDLLQALRDQGALIVLYALHGMQANICQEHFMPAIMDRINAYQDGDAAGHGRSDSSPGLMRLLRENVPDRLQLVVGQSVPVFVRDWVVDRSLTGGKDWRRTQGLTVGGDLNSYIRLNRSGREANGILEQGSTQERAYVDLLKRTFLGLRDAESNRPLVKAVIETQANGRADFLPDLVVEWHDEPPATRIVLPDMGEITSEIATGRGGNHRSAGFCLALNEARKSGDFQIDHITDLAALARFLVTESGPTATAPTPKSGLNQHA